MILKIVGRFLLLPFIIHVKMLSIYILIKSWAPWSNIHSLECKGPKIKPDSWHFIFLLRDLDAGPSRYQHFRKRKQGDNTCWPGPGCQLSVHIKIGPNVSWDNGQCLEWQILVSVCQDWHQCHCQCQAVTTLTTLSRVPCYTEHCVPLSSVNLNMSWWFNHLGWMEMEQWRC